MLEWMNVDVYNDSGFSDLQLINAIIHRIQTDQVNIIATPKQEVKWGIVAFHHRQACYGLQRGHS